VYVNYGQILREIYIYIYIPPLFFVTIADYRNLCIYVYIYICSINQSMDKYFCMAPDHFKSDRPIRPSTVKCHSHSVSPVVFFQEKHLHHLRCIKDLFQKTADGKGQGP